MQKLKITIIFWDGLENELIYGAVVNVVTFTCVSNSAFHSNTKSPLTANRRSVQTITAFYKGHAELK